MAKTAVRADSARTIDTVLHEAAQLLAEDPGASLVAIAAKAGVDRRTVYRHFECREMLIDTIYRTAYAAADRAMDEARLEDAPVVVALHRFFEGLVKVIRRYPIAQPQPDSENYGLRKAHDERLAAFLRRATDEGTLRADLPDGLALEVFQRTLGLLALQFGELEPGPVADLAVDILLNGLGAD